ncbi:putative ANTH domain-containing protein [Helianthus annuus]|nr:putative ANTH domain-containing protein [Helianthus annuus]
MYLDQKLELIAFERKLTAVGFRDDHGYGISHKPKYYAGRAKSSKMVLVALYLVLRESFRIYADICKALGVLLDRFTEMEYGNCVKTFHQYVIAAKRIDELVDFYSWSKELGVARATEFPEVQQVTDKILGTLERFLIEKKNKLKKNMEECCNEN